MVPNELLFQCFRSIKFGCSSLEEHTQSCLRTCLEYLQKESNRGVCLEGEANALKHALSSTSTCVEMYLSPAFTKSYIMHYVATSFFPTTYTSEFMRKLSISNEETGREDDVVLLKDSGFLASDLPQNYLLVVFILVLRIGNHAPLVEGRVLRCA